jgi:hypothetical protein
MGSGFDDCVYLHFFTITINYNSSHIELLLDNVCLKNLFEESWTKLCIWISQSQSQSQSQSYITTDGQSASLSWNKASIWGLRPDLCYCGTVAGFLMWGALSDERTGLSFAIVTVSSNRSVVSMYNMHFTSY